ncbi:MAG TPA: thiamine pyrophosphate-dependent enzyme [Vicinamibacterales bacterium]|nr:thiamine pyrophosphate-dependent enzyme [Vicinamibacterales bacterium]
MTAHGSHLASSFPDSRHTLLRVYRAMLTARLVDEQQALLVASGEGFFHIPGGGHEAIAALGPHLKQTDWLGCHYRDKALMIYRGVTPFELLCATLCKDSAPGRGRQLPDIIGSSKARILSTPVPVGNHALHVVGVASALRDLNPQDDSLAVCVAGDGTTQQGEYLEAVAEAVRRQLAVLFVVEDNGYAISTRTSGKTSLSRPEGPASDLLGIPVTELDGSDVCACLETFGTVADDVRARRQPRLVRLRVERLLSHSNADDQRLYRPSEELRGGVVRDPLIAGEKALVAAGFTEAELKWERDSLAMEVLHSRVRALSEPDPIPSADAYPPVLRVDGGRRDPVVPPENIAAALRNTLEQLLGADPRVVLIGEDIEDPKGDVFGITRGLSSRFPGRVINAALSESTIVGTAIGRSLVGQRPIAFIQFADFLPLAFNQIANELATIYWRSGGDYSCPVIILTACGAYKPGLGPFHSQTFEAHATHLPGLDVVVPSCAEDAVELLDAAFAGGRPTLFMYPKALLNVACSRTITGSAGVRDARRIRQGDAVTVVTWGNTVSVCERAADLLSSTDIDADVWDLRWLRPWDTAAVERSTKRTGHLLVVHEDNISGGLGAEIIAHVCEAVPGVRVGRVCRPDVLLPCHFDTQLALLPSVRSVVDGICNLVELDVEWQRSATPRRPDDIVIPAVGSPADDHVDVSQILVRVGQRVRRGDPVAVLEATKAAVEVVSPDDCTVEAIIARVGDSIQVGQPLLVGRATSTSERERSASVGLEQWTPRFGSGSSSASPGRKAPRQSGARPSALVSIVAQPGSREVTNQELLVRHPGKSDSDIIRRTAIQTRRWLTDRETLVGLAGVVAREALAQAAIDASELGLVLCSTGTPTHITPSMACQILGRLDPACRAAAFDLNAACAGYLYALRSAQDFIAASPGACALIVTAEAPSTLLNPDDFETAFLFGDAVTATVIVDVERLGRDRSGWHLHPAVVSSRPDLDDTLFVPLRGADARLRMHGQRVFSEAVKGMICAVHDACRQAGTSLDTIDLIVPHQANGRILDAIERRTKRRVLRIIDGVGNTSSSSIPLALSRLNGRAPERVAITAFGGGFTAGAAVLSRHDARR